MKRPPSDSPDPIGTTPTRLADELLSIGTMLSRVSIRTRQIGPYLHVLTLRPLLEEIQCAANRAADLAAAVRVGAVPIVADLLDRSAGAGDQPILDVVEANRKPLFDVLETIPPVSETVAAVSETIPATLPTAARAGEDSDRDRAIDDFGRAVRNGEPLLDRVLHHDVDQAAEVAAERWPPPAIDVNPNDDPATARRNGLVELADGEDEEEEPPTAEDYGPAHPWYYKLGGRLLSVDEIEAASGETMSPEWIAGFLRLPKNPKKREEKLRAELLKARTDLARSITEYQEMVDAWPDGRDEHERELDESAGRDSSNSYHYALSVTHNHVCYFKGIVKSLESLVGGPPEPVGDQVEEEKPADSDADERLRRDPRTAVYANVPPSVLSIHDRDVIAAVGIAADSDAAAAEELDLPPADPIAPHLDRSLKRVERFAADEAEAKRARKRDIDAKYQKKKRDARLLAKALGNPVESAGSVVGPPPPVEPPAIEPNRTWEVSDSRTNPPTVMGVVSAANITRAVLGAESTWPETFPPKSRFVRIVEIVRGRGAVPRSKVEPDLAALRAELDNPVTARNRAERLESRPPDPELANGRRKRSGVSP